MRKWIFLLAAMLLLLGIPALAAADGEGAGYTVDYYYGNEVFHQQGGTTVPLSRVLQELGIDVQPESVSGVRMDNEQLVAVEPAANDWNLISLKPFSTNQQLTLTLKNGQELCIAVKDAQGYTFYLDSQVVGTNPDPTHKYKYKVIYTNTAGQTITEYQEFDSVFTRKAYTIAQNSNFYAEFLPEGLTGYTIGLQLGSDAIQWNVDRADVRNIFYNGGAACFYIVYSTSIKHLKLTKDVVNPKNPDQVYHFEVLRHTYNYRYIKQTIDLKAGETADIDYVYVPGYENAIYISEVDAPSGCDTSFTLNDTKLPSGKVPGGHGDYTDTTWQAKVENVDKLANNATVVCTNKFEPAPAKVQFSGTKVLNNRQLKKDEFSFTLKKGSQTVQTVKNAADGTFSFSELSFSKTGRTTYTVVENNTQLPDVEYDTKTYTLYVDVTDDGSGTLKAAISGDSITGKDLKFENTYQVKAKVQFSGSKTLTGRANPPAKDEFSFVLTDKNDSVIETVKNAADGSITFSELSYDTIGVYDYKVKEASQSKDGVTVSDKVYNLTVTVTKDDGGRLQAAISGDSTTGTDLDFENTYQAAGTSVQFSGTKTLTGRALNKDEFSFVLTDKSGSEIETVKNAADGTITFTAIPYNAVGTYEYIVKEKPGSDTAIIYDRMEYQLTVTVTDDGKGQLQAAISDSSTTGTDLDFTNTYQAAGTSVQFSGTKTLTGRALVKDEFSFVLTGSDDDVLKTVKNGADGTFTFPEVTYTKAGTYHYTVKEAEVTETGVTGDSTVYQLTVTVTDDGKGQLHAAISGDSTTGTDLDFENTYQAQGTSVQFKGTKTLTGRKLNKDEFSFILSDADNKVIETVTNAESGAITFTAISYSKAGTYPYTVKEAPVSGSGLTGDTKVYQLTVTVTDDGKGQLQAAISGDSTTGTDLDFTNTYQAQGASVQFSGTKTLKGRALNKDEFSFVLTDKSGSEIETVKNDANGAFTFTVIPYSVAGTYEYIVKEVPGTTAHTIFDTKEYQLTVTVTDDGKGQLQAVISGGSTTGTDLNFTNYAEVGNLTVIKKVSGRFGDKEKDFRFQITLDDPTVNGRFGDVEFQNGRAEFRLQHEQVVSVTGLPAGCAYLVEEADYREQGYVTSATGERGVIAKNETKVAIFENEKNNEVPQTGDSMPLAALSLMMVLTAAGTLLCVKKRAR